MTFSFAAFPNPGYAFVEWNNGLTANNTSVTLNADNDYSMQADFVLKADVMNTFNFNSGGVVSTGSVPDILQQVTESKAACTSSVGPSTYGNDTSYTCQYDDTTDDLNLYYISSTDDINYGSQQPALPAGTFTTEILLWENLSAQAPDHDYRGIGAMNFAVAGTHCGTKTCLSSSLNAGDDFNLKSSFITVSSSISGLETSLSQKGTYYCEHDSTNATLFDLGYYYIEMENGLSDMMHTIPNGVATINLANFADAGMNPISCGTAILAVIVGVALLPETAGGSATVIASLVGVGLSGVAPVYAC